MRKEVKNFDRMDLFKHFHERTNPFSFVTTKIDITNLYRFCKKNKNVYATIGYYVTLAMNKVEAFKYRYEDGKVYYYDKLFPSYTQMFHDGNIGFFVCDIKDNYQNFVQEFHLVQEKFLEKNQSIEPEDQDVVWLSCEPWFNFTGCVPPFDKDTTIPQVIWDQFMIEEDKCYIDVMIMAHHGFVDGSHIGAFINEFRKLIENIEI